MADGARTRDISDHNRVLCQLSYNHQVFSIFSLSVGMTRFEHATFRSQSGRSTKLSYTPLNISAVTYLLLPLQTLSEQLVLYLTFRL